MTTSLMELTWQSFSLHGVEEKPRPDEIDWRDEARTTELSHLTVALASAILRTPMDPTQSQADQKPLRMIAMLPSIGQPRHGKRLDTLAQRGFETTALAFERKYHSGRVPNCPIVVVGKAVERRHAGRLLALIKAWPEVRRRIRGCEIVYAFGTDMALLAVMGRLFGKTSIVMEISDIVPIQVNASWRGRIFRIVDKWVTSRCQLIVTTTPKFLSEYYQRRLGVHVPGIVLENKVDAAFGTSVRQDAQSRAPSSTDPIRIGYFGLIGCPWSVEVLKTLVTRHPNRFEVCFAGYRWPTVDLDRYLATTPNFLYSGEFKSPRDLPKIYGEVDVTWVCYPPIGPSDWNLRWARPNRFYESCLFCVPVVSREGSCDSVDVARFKIGLVMDKVAVQEAADVLATHLTHENLAQWRENMRSVPEDVYQYTTEFDRLASLMRALVHLHH